MLDRVHFREERDGELVFCHRCADTRVVAQAREEVKRARGVREVREREETVEGV